MIITISGRITYPIKEAVLEWVLQPEMQQLRPHIEVPNLSPEDKHIHNGTIRITGQLTEPGRIKTIVPNIIQEEIRAGNIKMHIAGLGIEEKVSSADSFRFCFFRDIIKQREYPKGIVYECTEKYPFEIRWLYVYYNQGRVRLLLHRIVVDDSFKWISYSCDEKFEGTLEELMQQYPTIALYTIVRWKG